MFETTGDVVGNQATPLVVPLGVGGGESAIPFTESTQVGQIPPLQSFASSGSDLGTVVTPLAKIEPGLEYGWPDFDNFDVSTLGIDDLCCGCGNGSGHEKDIGVPGGSSDVVAASERPELRQPVQSETMSSATGKESLKKRKYQKVKNPKADGAKEKKLKGRTEEEEEEEEEEESMITEQASNKNTTDKNTRKTSANTSKGHSKLSSEAQKRGYIHVRARRGQATDSHSLAERARREKISEKMRFLQSLVPGCNKIMGKAGMLDEIINYVQTLQHQVEFLSMKLDAVSPEFNFQDNSFAKGLCPCSETLAGIGMATETADATYIQSNSAQEAVSSCGMGFRVYDSDMALRRTISAPLSAPETCFDYSSLIPIQTYSDADDQSIYHLEVQGR